MTATAKTRAALTIAPKATGSGLGGSLTVIILYLLSSIWGIEPPVEVAAAITALISWLGAYLSPRAVGP